MPRLLRCLFRFCGRTSCLGLNLLLLTTAALQTTLLLFHFFQQYTPVPTRPLQQFLKEILPPQSGQPSWAKLKIDLAGNLLFSDFQLQHPHQTHPFFSADHLLLQTRLLHLLLPGGQPVRDIRALNAAFTAPPQLSPSGLPEKLITFPFLSVQPTPGQQFRVPLIHAQHQQFHLLFSAQQPFQLPAFPDHPAASPLPSTLRAVWKLPALLPPQASAIALLQPNPNRHDAFSLTATLPQLPLAGSLLQKLHLNVQTNFSNPQPAVTSINVSGRLLMDAPASSAVLPSQQIPFQATLHGTPVSLPNLLLPAQFTLSTKLRLHHSPHPLHLALRSASPENPLAVQWFAHQPDALLTGRLQPSLPALLAKGVPDSPAAWLPALPQNIPVRAHFTHPRPLRPFLPQLPFSTQTAHLRFSNAAFQGTFSPANSTLKGQFHFRNLHLNQTDIPFLASSIELSPSALHLPRAFLRLAPDQFIQASFRFHFPSQSYAFHGSGNLLPRSLNPFLGDWWSGLFTQIKPTVPPQANVSLWGQNGDGLPPTASLFIQVDHARLHEVEIPRLSLSMETSPQWAWVRRLNAQFPKGSVTGELAWHLDNPPDTKRPLQVDLQGQLPFAKGLHLCGLQPPPSLRVIGTPAFHAKGTLWRRARNEPEKTPLQPDLTIAVQPSGSEILYRGLRLTKARLTASVKQSRLSLSPITASIAGGILSGSLQIQLPAPQINKPGLRALDLQVFDASYPVLTDQLASLVDDPQPIRRAFLTRSARGRMDLQASLSGPRGPSSGHGSLTIRDGSVATIHLFGGLSASLDQLGLGFSSMGLTNASLQWQWQDPTLFLETLSVRGPVLHLDLAGQLNLHRQSIDLAGRARLFDGLMRNLLAPVSKSVGLRVSGPLNDPSWSLSINPLRWLVDPTPSINTPREL